MDETAVNQMHKNATRTKRSDTMPQQYNPGGQDWAPVNVGRAGTGGLKAVPKTAQELSLAKAAGLVATEKRHGAGGNKSAHSGGALSARKLEEADDVGTIAKVDKSLSKAIMQVRVTLVMEFVSNFPSHLCTFIFSC